jgi:hypothetical protein
MAERETNIVRTDAGFSLVELVISTALSVLILGVGIATFTGAIGRRERESMPFLAFHTTGWSRATTIAMIHDCISARM